MTVDHSDGWFRQRPQGKNTGIVRSSQIGDAAAALGELLHVEPAAEELSRTGDDHGANLVIIARQVALCSQRVVEFAADCVGRRAVKRQYPYDVADIFCFDQHR